MWISWILASLKYRGELGQEETVFMIWSNVNDGSEQVMSDPIVYEVKMLSSYSE